MVSIGSGLHIQGCTFHFVADPLLSSDQACIMVRWSLLERLSLFLVLSLAVLLPSLLCFPLCTPSVIFYWALSFASLNLGETHFCPSSPLALSLVPLSLFGLTLHSAPLAHDCRELLLFGYLDLTLRALPLSLFFPLSHMCTHTQLYGSVFARATPPYNFLILQ